MKTSWQQLLTEHVSCAQAIALPHLSMNHVQDGRMYVRRLRSHVLVAGKRRSVPTHSVPPEVLAMCLLPTWKLDKPRVRAMLGIGSTSAMLFAHAIARVFEAAYIHLSRSGCTPLKWHRSWTAALDKRNCKPGVYGKRMVRRLDPQGNAFLIENNAQQT